MAWYFEPHHDHDGERHDDGDPAQGLGIPAAVLRRHGARVLNPADAADVTGSPVRRTTVYRARTLLVPLKLVPDLELVNDVLSRVGMSVVVPGPGHVTESADREVPVTAVLIPASRGEMAGRPVVVDAWQALQALRAAGLPGVELEHVLAGSAITGTLAGEPVTDGGGLSGPDSAGSYLFSGGDTRLPIQVCMAAPARRSGRYCARRYGRRAVIAVLDTGIRAHPWLDVAPDPVSGGYRMPADGFVAVDAGIQAAIYASAAQLSAAGDQQRRLIEDPWDRPVTNQPLVGGLGSHDGHGTFIAGIARQVAPDAQVLAVRIMHSDGIAYMADLLQALRSLADRVRFAQAGDMSQMVDVVSLSLGYFSEEPADLADTWALRGAIDELRALGVAVIACAGNQATRTRFYPAAFADQAPDPERAPIVSVGALNPNGSKALFSNDGCWVRAFAPGAAVVSTFPADVNGSRDPQMCLPADQASTIPPGLDLPGQRAALDPDDFRGTGSGADGSALAVWSGTSFSAPYIASLIARELMAAAKAGGGRLDATGAKEALTRTEQAMTRLGWPG